MFRAKFVKINWLRAVLAAAGLCLLLPWAAAAQLDDICREAGYMPSLDPPFSNIPYIYGRVSVKGLDASAKLPVVTVTMVDAQQAVYKTTLNKSGNYCFKVRNRGGTLIIDVGGVEAVRKSLPSFGPSQLREDFEIQASPAENLAPPGVISARFHRPPNPKTVDLYKKTGEAKSKKDSKKVIEHLTEIVRIDPEDFIAWAELGVIYQETEQLAEAEAAFRKALELKIEYTPAWINVGIIRMSQKQFEAAIEIFKHAAGLEPKSPRIFQLLGEAYLQTRQGTLGADALNKALELDPVGMAACHLQLAHLYQLAGANKLATREYKQFLKKVPDHPEKKKFEEFIKKNPE